MVEQRHQDQVPAPAKDTHQPQAGGAPCPRWRGDQGGNIRDGAGWNGLLRLAADAQHGFRRWFDGLGEHYMLAVPGHTLRRDLETAPSEYTSRGRRLQRSWQRVEAWSASLADGAWKRIDVRDGTKGPLVVDVVTRRVVARTPRWQQGDEGLVVVLCFPPPRQPAGRAGGLLSG